MQKEAGRTYFIALTAFIAGLVYILNLMNPVAFGVYAFRPSSALRALFIVMPELSVGFALGNYITNFTAGKIFPLFWLIPALNIPVAYLAFWAKRKFKSDLLGLLVINTLMSLFIGYNYYLLSKIPLTVNFISKFIGEGVALAVGYLVLKAVFRR